MQKRGGGKVTYLWFRPPWGSPAGTLDWCRWAGTPGCLSWAGTLAWWIWPGTGAGGALFWQGLHAAVEAAPVPVPASGAPNAAASGTGSGRAATSGQPRPEPIYRFSRDGRSGSVTFPREP